MGIENFFNSIIKNKIISENLLVTNKIDVEYLFIDFNSIVYSVSDTIEKDFNYLLYAIIINELDDDNIKRIYTEYNISINTIKGFEEFFTKDKINEIIINNIIKYIENICKNIIDSTKLKQLYIALDGVPTMAKIIEQKKRRYMGYIIEETCKKIFDKNYDKIINDEYYFLYRKYKLTFDRSQITSWSTIMQIISNNLASEEFKFKIQQFCYNLKKIIVSSTYELGEGEKKIMEYILTNKIKGKIAIYTPDSDVIVLSMILYNKLNNCNSVNTCNSDNNCINLLRHNQIENVIDVISINSLIENIINLIKKKVSYIDYNKNSINVINDIITIITFMGNDFLPKMQSLYSKNSIEIVIDIYIKFLNWNRNTYKFITFDDKITGTMKINYDNIINIIKKFSENEDKLIYDSYLSLEYKNYSYLLKVFDENSYTCYLLDKINRYIHGFNKVIKYIKDNKNATAQDVYDNVINKFTDKTVWEQQFIKIEGDNEYTTCMNILNIIIENLNNKSGDNKSGDNKLNYKCGLRLVKFSKTIDDKFHQTFLKQNMIHPKMKINEYFIEKYKLENMLDEYKNIDLTQELNLFDNFGYVELKYKNSEYKIHIDRRIDSKKNYYYSKIMNCQSQANIDKLCEDYIRGFFWTYDYYFNKNDRNININYISTWGYEYNRTPFFTELLSYLNIIKNKNFELNKLFQSVSDVNGVLYKKSHEFLSRVEQFMFITPKCKHYDIPDNYKNLMDDLDIFPNLDETINSLLNKNNKNIDSFNIKYLNKCKLIGLVNHNINNFFTKLNTYRL